MPTDSHTVSNRNKKKKKTKKQLLEKNKHIAPWPQCAHLDVSRFFLFFWHIYFFHHQILLFLCFPCFAFLFLVSSFFLSFDISPSIKTITITPKSFLDIHNVETKQQKTVEQKKKANSDKSNNKKIFLIFEMSNHFYFYFYCY